MVRLPVLQHQACLPTSLQTSFTLPPAAGPAAHSSRSPTTTPSPPTSTARRRPRRPSRIAPSSRRRWTTSTGCDAPSSPRLNPCEYNLKCYVDSKAMYWFASLFSFCLVHFLHIAIEDSTAELSWMKECSNRMGSDCARCFILGSNPLAGKRQEARSGLSGESSLRLEPSQGL